MNGELSLDHARTFLTAYRAGSLSQAARSLGLSQSTVTAQIAAFERDLGYALFERTPNGVIATPRANSIAAGIASHLDELERTLWAAQPGLGSESRTLHLAGPSEFLSAHLLPQLETWRPHSVSLRVQFGLAEQLLAELRSGVHDLIVSAVPVRGTEFDTTPLYDEEFALVGAPAWADHLLANSAIPPGTDMNMGIDLNMPIIAYAADLPIIRRWWRTVWGQRPSNLNVIATVPDLRTITAMVRSGVGVSVLPTYLIENDLADGSLRKLADPELPPLNTLSLVTRAGALARDAQLAGVHSALLSFNTSRQ